MLIQRAHHFVLLNDVSLEAAKRDTLDGVKVNWERRVAFVVGVYRCFKIFKLSHVQDICRLALFFHYCDSSMCSTCISSTAVSLIS